MYHPAVRTTPLIVFCLFLSVGCSTPPKKPGYFEDLGNGNSPKVVDCVSELDCDNDSIQDNVDIDDDGDGLIEIATAEQLDAIRWVLNGSGFKVDADATLNQTGCGDGKNVMECSGYELIDNISLTNYAEKKYSTKGWKPITLDINTTNNYCNTNPFTGTFDGNNFVVSDLSINRPSEDCIGLFGHTDGTIYRLGVVASRIIGRTNVGGLVGSSRNTEIIQSYVVSGNISGDDNVGGLIGKADSTEVNQSYTVSGNISGDNDVGGLIGGAVSTRIVQSYAASGNINGDNGMGGLVGKGNFTDIIQSYGVSGAISGDDGVGGLVGKGHSIGIIQSYTVSGPISGNGNLGGLVGQGGTAQDSYWDKETSGKANDAAIGSSGQTTIALRSPIDYSDIYATWDDGVMVDGIDNNSTIWCDEDLSGMIETDEMRNIGHTNGDNRVWDFGTDTDYPVLRCTGDSLADQRSYLGVWSKKSPAPIGNDIDNDSIPDDDGNCPFNQNTNQLDTDKDGQGDVCDEDKGGDDIANVDEVVDCVLKWDCDGDKVYDSVDIDDDGDGLIEIETVEELYAVRYQLDGTGFKVDANAQLDQAGCGNGKNIMKCFGYELVKDISLADYINEINTVKGWKPIAHDDDPKNNICDGKQFTGIFDGNGFVVRGLSIYRPTEDCIGLFGQVGDGVIRNLGVIATSITGRNRVGVLVGHGGNINQSYAISNVVKGVGGPDDPVGSRSYFIGGLVGAGGQLIVQSYAISDEISGDEVIGGLVGAGGNTTIIQSYAVTGKVSGVNRVGGLAGRGHFAKIIQSYAVSDAVRGNWAIGGLVGSDWGAEVIQSYAVSGEVNGVNGVGGLIGWGRSAKIVQSYAVSGSVLRREDIGGLVGKEEDVKINASYWDTETNDGTDDSTTDSSRQTTTALRSSTDYTDIYKMWDDGVEVDGIDYNSTRWCDEDQSSMIEADEMQDNNRVWDLGTNKDYPAIRCTADSLTEQRTWWDLNSNHKPQLNRNYLDAWLDGSPP